MKETSTRGAPRPHSRRGGGDARRIRLPRHHDAGSGAARLGVQGGRCMPVRQQAGACSRPSSGRNADSVRTVVETHLDGAAPVDEALAEFGGRWPGCCWARARSRSTGRRSPRRGRRRSSPGFSPSRGARPTLPGLHPLSRRPPVGRRARLRRRGAGGGGLHRLADRRCAGAPDCSASWRRRTASRWRAGRGAPPGCSC